MKFLPLSLNDKFVYAGFCKRFFAGLIDMLIIIPLALLFGWLEELDRTLAIVINIFWLILFVMFNVFFNAHFGGTPGKLAIGIRITKPDGSRISWPEAWKRSAVDIVFVFITSVTKSWALMQLDPSSYDSLGFMERIQLLEEYLPTWYSSVIFIQEVWIWSELIVLLFNKRKRAIHDFIAGTVVVMKEFAK